MVHPEHGEVRDAVAQDWAVALERAGAVPVHVPNALEDPGQWLRTVGVGALILSGGEDCGELVTGRHNPAGLSVRDRTELDLLAHATRSGLATLGVCRGAQLLNWRFGGSVERGDGHRGRTHLVAAVADRAGIAAGATLQVNSYHDNVIAPSSLAPGLAALALAEDGTIEAFTHPELPLLAVQWDPERPIADDRAGIGLLRSWLASCA